MPDLFRSARQRGRHPAGGTRVHVDAESRGARITAGAVARASRPDPNARPSSSANPIPATTLCARTAAGAAAHAAAARPSTTCTTAAAMRVAPSRCRPCRCAHHPTPSAHGAASSASARCPLGAVSASRAPANAPSAAWADHNTAPARAARASGPSRGRGGLQSTRQAPRQSEHRQPTEQVAQQHPCRTGSRGHDAQHRQGQRQRRQRDGEGTLGALTRPPRERQPRHRKHGQQHRRRGHAVRAAHQRQRARVAHHRRRRHAQRRAIRAAATGPVRARGSGLGQAEPGAGAGDDEHQQQRGPGQAAHQASTTIDVHGDKVVGRMGGRRGVAARRCFRPEPGVRADSARAKADFLT